MVEALNDSLQDGPHNAGSLMDSDPVSLKLTMQAAPLLDSATAVMYPDPSKTHKDATVFLIFFVGGGAVSRTKKERVRSGTNMKPINECTETTEENCFRRTILHDCVLDRAVLHHQAEVFKKWLLFEGSYRTLRCILLSSRDDISWYDMATLARNIQFLQSFEPFAEPSHRFIPLPFAQRGDLFPRKLAHGTCCSGVAVERSDCFATVLGDKTADTFVVAHMLEARLLALSTL
jgi:hypothetical protein